MKKITSILSFILVFTLFSNNLNAQDGYSYTLVNNGSYSFSISAVPNSSSSNFETSVQSYGFTIILPDGVTADITSSFGNGAGATFFSGTDVGQPTIDGYLIVEVLAGPLPLPAPSLETIFPMVTIQVNGSPTTGEIYLLANNSSLATNVTPLKSFMSADVVDDDMFLFPPVVDAVGSGLSGITSYSFDTLSIENILLENISIYPNPAANTFYIQGLMETTSVSIYDISGKMMMTQATSSNQAIAIDTLASGIYMVSIKNNNGSVVKKLVIE